MGLAYYRAAPAVSVRVPVRCLYPLFVRELTSENKKSVCSDLKFLKILKNV
jgi:hypothetical protein